MFSLLLLFLLPGVAMAAEHQLRRRRIVDLVFDRSIIKSDRTEMLPIFAELLPIQTHSTGETDCADIFETLKSRHEDDFLVLIGIQEIICPKQICKKNFASILLPADVNESRTVSYGCQGKRQPIDWKTISLNIRSQQKDNMLEELPDDYMKEGEEGLGKAVVAGFAVMGLVIVGLFLVIIFSKINHLKEVKILKEKAQGHMEEKKNGASDAKKDRKTAKTDSTKTASVMTTERSSKSQRSTK